MFVDFDVFHFQGRNVVDVASMFKRGKILSELKTFEQASHRIVS